MMSITIRINYMLPDVELRTLIVHSTELIMLGGKEEGAREGEARIYIISGRSDAPGSQ